MPPRHQYRVTKFDPANRNEAGNYTADEWYLHCQIGDTFDGVLLTEDEYLRVEDAYIATALRFHSDAGQPDIFAISVEDNRKLGAPAEGSLITSNQLPALCRAMLRGDYWCRIEGRDFFIHFGYDFYMYIGACAATEHTLDFARSEGLFPEPFASPYHPEHD
jgi:hypothetical protein